MLTSLALLLIAPRPVRATLEFRVADAPIVTPANGRGTLMVSVYPAGPFAKWSRGAPMRKPAPLARAWGDPDGVAEPKRGVRYVKTLEIAAPDRARLVAEFYWLEGARDRVDFFGLDELGTIGTTPTFRLRSGRVRLPASLAPSRALPGA